jgi:hypothetical protein
MHAAALWLKAIEGFLLKIGSIKLRPRSIIRAAHHFNPAWYHRLALMAGVRGLMRVRIIFGTGPDYFPSVAPASVPALLLPKKRGR